MVETAASAVDLSVVIPAYNEEAVLDETLDDVIRYLASRAGSFEVIVVDDGSPDRTTEMAQGWASRDSRVRLIRLERNHGKGYAVKTGMLAARGEIALFMDADGATGIGEFDQFATAVQDGADVVMASRWLSASRIEVAQPWRRRLLGRVAHQLSRWVIGAPLTDFSCGFKAFSAKARAALFPRLRIDRWVFDHEIIWLAQAQGLRMVELPVHWRHRPHSKVKPVRDAIRSLIGLFQIRLNAWRGRYR